MHPRTLRAISVNRGFGRPSALRVRADRIECQVGRVGVNKASRSFDWPRKAVETGHCRNLEAGSDTDFRDSHEEHGA